MQRYGSQLRQARDFPSYVSEIKAPEGIQLAADSTANSRSSAAAAASSMVYELEGDVSALKLVDLDREGLAEYKSQVVRSLTSAPPPHLPPAAHSLTSFSQPQSVLTQVGNISRISISSSPSSAQVSSQSGANANQLTSESMQQYLRATSSVSSTLSPGTPTPSTMTRSSSTLFPPLSFSSLWPFTSTGTLINNFYSPSSAASVSTSSASIQQAPPPASQSAAAPAPTPAASRVNSAAAQHVEQLFGTITRAQAHESKISREDAERVLLWLNSRLGRAYGEDDVSDFFAQLDINQDGFIDLDEFKRILLL